jgi:hypothetical protein
MSPIPIHAKEAIVAVSITFELFEILTMCILLPSNSIPRPSYGKHFKNISRVLAIIHPDATRNVVVCNSSEYPILMLWDSTAGTV